MKSSVVGSVDCDSQPEAGERVSPPAVYSSVSVTSAATLAATDDACTLSSSVAAGSSSSTVLVSALVVGSIARRALLDFLVANNPIAKSKGYNMILKALQLGY